MGDGWSGWVRVVKNKLSTFLLFWHKQQIENSAVNAKAEAPFWIPVQRGEGGGPEGRRGVTRDRS